MNEILDKKQKELERQLEEAEVTAKMNEAAGVSSDKKKSEKCIQAMKKEGRKYKLFSLFPF